MLLIVEEFSREETNLAAESIHVCHKNVLSSEPKVCAQLQLNQLWGTSLKFSYKIRPKHTNYWQVNNSLLKYLSVMVLKKTMRQPKTS